VLQDLVILAGPLDRHDQIAQPMLPAGGLESGDGEVQFRPVVLDRSREDEDLAVEVAQHPLEARLGTIDADDAEMLGPDRCTRG